MGQDARHDPVRTFVAAVWLHKKETVDDIALSTRAPHRRRLTPPSSLAAKNFEGGTDSDKE